MPVETIYRIQSHPADCGDVEDLSSTHKRRHAKPCASAAWPRDQADALARKPGSGGSTGDVGGCDAHALIERTAKLLWLTHGHDGLRAPCADSAHRCLRSGRNSPGSCSTPS
jgi:hypothetical protein